MNELYLKLLTVITKRMDEKQYIIKSVEILNDGENSTISLLVKTTSKDVYTYSINTIRAQNFTLKQMMEHVWLWKYVKK